MYRRLCRILQHMQTRSGKGKGRTAARLVVIECLALALMILILYGLASAALDLVRTVVCRVCGILGGWCCKRCGNRTKLPYPADDELENRMRLDKNLHGAQNFTILVSSRL